ncbi:MAG: nucleotidyltransferase domain-containing protein, partial [Bacteroidota bacterium]
FGSALRDGFSPQSDIDFLYELAHQHLDGKQSIEAFLGFEQALRTLLDREIELVWYTGIRNPYFKAEVDEQKVLIYDQKAEKVSV